MLVFLLKSTACLVIFLAFYKLVLEKESIHQFKRFFLLGALIASFLIPAVVFTEYVEVAQPTTFSTTPITEISDTATGQVATEESYFDWEIGLWMVYVIGVIGFGVRFLRNLAQIALRIRKNPKFKENFITRVLLRQSLPPHTFFNYIFLNQRQFEEKHIPQEVLLHEETHAKQRHSLDILFIELAQVILWFNPIIYLFKSSIKLNHEFLADRAVINGNDDHSQYQNTILSYLSHGSFEQHQSTGIANAINYSSIKKRFTVMKTNTSRKSFVLRSLLVLPLTALLLFGFSETEVIPVVKNVSSETSIYPKSNNLNAVEGLSRRSIELAGLVVDSETLLPLENATILGTDGQILSKTDNRGYYAVELEVTNPGEIYFDFSVTKEGYKLINQKEHWGDLQGNISSAMYFAMRQKKSNSKELSSLVTNPKNLDYETILTSYKHVKEDFEFHKKMDEAKRGNQNVFMQVEGQHYLVSDSWIKLNSKDDLVMVDGKTIVPAYKLNKTIKRNQITGMTPLEAGQGADFAIYTVSAQKAIDFIEIDINNKGNLLFQGKIVPLKDLKETLSKVNEHLSFDQRKKIVRSVIQVEDNTPKDVIQQVDKILSEYGAATINIVGPETSTQSSATREEMKEYNALAKKYNAMDQSHMIIKKQEVMRLKEIYGKMSKKQQEDAEPFPNFPPPPPAPDATEPPSNPPATEVTVHSPSGVVPVHEPTSTLPAPPPPPEPKSPMEHIKEMAAKGATFMHNGKEISAKEAIKVLENNKSINIDTRGSDSGKPIVKLSTEPIVIEN
jgi:Antirepressor regulating drug resistance, predicted signal transduction N-terminal membrane component